MTSNIEPTWDSLLLTDSDPEWTDAKPFPKAVSFITGNRNSRAMRARYFEKKKPKRFAGRAWFGPEAEGPPGHAHGGAQAALLDEGMGAVAWLSGHAVLAAKIEVNFRAPLPLGTTLTMWCEITKTDGRKIYSKGRLEGDDGTVFSEGTGLFIVIDPEKLMQGKK